jgi:hypothetical protein
MANRIIPGSLGLHPGDYSASDIEPESELDSRTSMAGNSALTSSTPPQKKNEGRVPWIGREITGRPASQQAPTPSKPSEGTGDPTQVNAGGSVAFSAVTALPKGPTLPGPGAPTGRNTSSPTKENLAKHGGIALNALGTIPTHTVSSTTSSTTPSGRSGRPKTHNYREEITWGGYTYVLDQNLPKGSKNLWKEYVKGYMKVLKKIEDDEDSSIRPGVSELELIPKKDIGIEVRECGDGADKAHTVTIDDVETKAFANDVCMHKASEPVRARSTESARTRDPLPEATRRDLLPAATSGDPLPDNEPTQLPPIGLSNPSGTMCYGNSLLQIAASCPDLRKQLAHQTKDKLLQELINLYQTDRQNLKHVSALDTTNLLPVMEPARDARAPVRPRQECIGEAFQQIIGRCLPNENVYINTEYENDVADDVVLTNGYTKKEGRKGKAYRTVSEEKSPILHLDMPRPNGSGNTMNVVDLIQYQYTQKKQIDAVDTISNVERKRTNESITLGTPPKFLALHPQRFYMKDGTVEKNQNKIDLLERFDAPREMMTRGTPASYQLRGFAVHIGDETDHGHYVSYVKIKGEGNLTHYYKINDPQSEEIEPDAFLKAGKDFAFALYQKLPDQAVSSTPPPGAGEQNDFRSCEDPNVEREEILSNPEDDDGRFEDVVSHPPTPRPGVNDPVPPNQSSASLV